MLTPKWRSRHHIVRAIAKRRLVHEQFPGKTSHGASHETQYVNMSQTSDFDDDDPSDPSDEELRAMGLEETRAWVRVQETGKARRNRRYRERAAAQGQRPFSTLVPDETRETVRLICRQLCDGELNLEDLNALVTADLRRPDAGAANDTAANADSVNDDGKVVRQILAVAAVGVIAFAAGITIALAWA